MAAIIPKLSDYPVRKDGGSKVLISVVTTVWNGVRTLPRTMDSIRAQTMLGLEYVVIDAGSTDGTLDLLAANSDVVTFWKSEPDRGISDGFNKAIALSTGKYVAIVNADDWLSPGQLAAGIETLERTGADFVFGDLLYHDTEGRLLYRVQGDPTYVRRIGHVMPALNHPTVIVRRSAYERFGLFDLTLRYAMDYDLLLRFHRAGCVGVYDPRMTGHMALAGASDTASLHALREVRDIAIRHGQRQLPAQTLYAFRLMKDKARRLIEKTLPPGLSVALRGLANHNLVKAR
jgi:glycosyltransferase involved in cell wall biosynthesis